MVKQTERDHQIQLFLDTQGWQGAIRQKISGDASFRQYERLHRNNKPPAILMDAPPPKERVDQFLGIAKILSNMGVSVPQFYAVDQQQGLIIMEDFGDNTYTRLLQSGYPEKDLYQLAVDLLIHLYQQSTANIISLLPDFDHLKVLNQVQVFLDWYWPEIYQEPVQQHVRHDFISLWQKMFDDFRVGKHALTHFDFHVDNLMLLPNRAGIKACGLLDFQDAVRGSAVFDCMSLLDDARRDVPRPMAHQLKKYFLDTFPKNEREYLNQSYAFWGAQRHTRILGTFIRLYRRDNKPGYLQFIPRVWGQLQTTLKEPHMRPLQQWFANYFPEPKQKVEKHV
ncbi:MAG: phosphotransferase [Alphaproteobacteria bacterium]|nr:phosphotransferase [Alphaproteobacteria bacterium]